MVSSRFLYFFFIFNVIFITLQCKENQGSNYIEAQDPFSPAPGQKDAFEDDNSTEFASTLDLSGLKQIHSFHYREDNDWYKLNIEAGENVIIETFNVSQNISTILHVYVKDVSSGIIDKVWGSDTGSVISDTQLGDYDFAAQPDSMKEYDKSDALDKRVRLKRKSTVNTSLQYFVKATIPPFVYRNGIETNYSIRARGSKHYDFQPVSNVTATRESFADRIYVHWQQSSGATSYRLLRSTAQIADSVTCQWPCSATPAGVTDATLVKKKAAYNAGYILKTDDKTEDGSCTATGDGKAGNCDTVIKTISDTETVYTDSGSWVKSAAGSLRCAESESIETYTFNSSLNSERLELVSSNDSTDISANLPSTTAPQYIQAQSCQNLPNDTSSADDPQVGTIYYYAVFACDDILETCTAHSGTDEQANMPYDQSGGGSLRIDIKKPQIEYVSDIQSDGIWIAWRHINSNKPVSADFKYIRYSIQRSNSSNGPWQEVECSLYNGTEGDLLLEKDEAADSTALDQGKIYYYRVIAQQLLEGISCSGENCLSSIEDARGATSENPSTGNDDGCANDILYLPTGYPQYAEQEQQSASESAFYSEASNILSGHREFLGNIGMCVSYNRSGYGGYIKLRNTLNEKFIELTEHSLSGAASASQTIDISSYQTIDSLCSTINSKPNFSCNTTCANHSDFRNLPASYLKAINEEALLPDGGATYGNTERPMLIENRLFATDGYYSDKIKVRWAPVVGASSYVLYRIDTPVETSAAYIKMIYHGNAYSAKVMVTSTGLFTQLSGQTDQSQNIAIDFSSPQTDTVDEVLSYINRQKGYSAWVNMPQYKVFSATKINPTSNPGFGDYLDMSSKDDTGLPVPVTVNASVNVPIIPDDLSVDKFSGEGSSWQKTVYDSVTESNINLTFTLIKVIDQAYSVSEFSSTISDSTIGVNSDQYYLLQAYSATAGTGNRSYSFLPARGIKRSFSGSAASFDMITSAADNDEYDIIDVMLSQHLASSTLNTDSRYAQYIQHDNDTFTGLPASSGDVFDLKIGTHNAHPSFSGIGYNAAQRPATFLPESFHNPGTNARWPGDPDIIYDDNSGNPGTEPANSVSLALNSPYDVDYLWFFAQRKYYSFSQYEDYSYEYTSYPGSGHSSGDKGCLSTLHGGPFSGDGSDPATDARLCSYNSTAFSGSSPDNTDIDAIERIATRKRYSIAISNASEGFNAPLIADFYLSWPNFAAYHSGSGLNPGLHVAPQISQAPFYSARIESTVQVKLPSAANMKDFRGFGLLQFDACDTDSDTDGVKETHSSAAPCLMTPVCHYNSNSATDSLAINDRYSSTDITTACAGMPANSLKLCNVDTNGDNIYDRYDFNNDGSYTADDKYETNMQACLPGPFYSGSNYYNGDTCTSSNKAQCAPMAGHIIMRLYSPEKSTGRITVKVSELNDASDSYDFPD